ncbi:MAG: hypothetical protein V3R52_01690 [Candidatus Neomarinimicrobiota bacterium]
MLWLKEDGLAFVEMITLFALVSVLTFAALPHYNNLIKQTHKAKVLQMYNKINTYIIISGADSLSVDGIFKVPFPSQITSNNLNNLSDSNKWTNNGSGIYTYLPTGTQIIYRRINQNNYSFIIRDRD